MASAASPTWNLTHDAPQNNRAFSGQRTIHMANSHAKQFPSMNGEETEESKCASAWSVISNHSAPSSGKQFNTPVSACTDVRQPVAFPSCRLFGFDLKSPSMVTLKPVDITNDAGEVYAPSILSSCDLEQKSCVTKEVKQDHLQGMTKEVQSRQSNSSRSRTKVYFGNIIIESYVFNAH